MLPAPELEPQRNGTSAVTTRPAAHVMGERASTTWYLCLGTFVAAHVFLVNHFVPFHEVFSAHPLQGIDYDLHIGQVFRVVDSLRNWGHSWSYDVQLLAGQPEGTITDSGSKAWELWAFALHQLGVPKPIAFNT